MLVMATGAQAAMLARKSKLINQQAYQISFNEVFYMLGFVFIGLIFVVCVLLFRRGIVGEAYRLLRYRMASRPARHNQPSMT